MGLCGSEVATTVAGADRLPAASIACTFTVYVRPGTTPLACAARLVRPTTLDCCICVPSHTLTRCQAVVGSVDGDQLTWSEVSSPTTWRLVGGATKGVKPLPPEATAELIRSRSGMATRSKGKSSINMVRAGEVMRRRYRFERLE